jgi:hypothetical protein
MTQPGMTLTSQGRVLAASPVGQRRFRAMLWGGKAGCKPVFVDELRSEICAYQNGGAAFAADEGAELPTGTVCLGHYELVGPLGPETPVYVARA